MWLLLGLSSALLNTILFTRLVSTGGTNNNREENKISLLSNVKLAFFKCVFLPEICFALSGALYVMDGFRNPSHGTNSFAGAPILQICSAKVCF